LQNTSIGLDKVFGYRWEFDINGKKETRDTKDASFDFGVPGDYTGLMVLNPGTICTDTAKINVKVFPSVKAQFDATLPGCNIGAVAFKNTSVLNQGATLRTIEWDFGDKTKATEGSPQHTYALAGSYPVSLTIATNTGCRDTAKQVVSYFPASQVDVRLVALPSEVCSQTGVVKLSLNVPAVMNQPGYRITWDFGDSTSGTGYSVNKTYANPGTYTVAYQLLAPGGCAVAGNNANRPISVKLKPSVDFTFSPTEPSVRNPLVMQTTGAGILLVKAVLRNATPAFLFLLKEYFR
jgi:chitodextrinase